MSEEKSKDKADKKENQKQETETPVWEWIIAAIGLVLVLAAIGSTAYRALTEEKTPPKLHAVVESKQPNGDGFLVRFRIENTGNQTAAAVGIEGELKNGEETAETSASTLAYSPANSVRRGGLFFTKNPDQYNLQIRVTGYEEP